MWTRAVHNAWLGTRDQSLANTAELFGFYLDLPLSNDSE